MQESFVDLERTFSKIGSDFELSIHDNFNNYQFFNDNSIGWDHIIKSQGISVILGEAGSGKTTELINQSSVLKKRGVNSFFIELEKLIDNYDHKVVRNEDIVKFDEWLKGAEKAIIFLDSIDESKFEKKSHFRDSINNFKNLIGLINLERCTIILSSRFSEWHHGSDKKLLEELLPKKNLQLKNDNLIRGEVISENLPPSKQEEVSKSESNIAVYKLNPLDREQVKKLANHILKGEEDHFISEIDKSYAWSLTTRPLDVEGLIFVWRDNGKLGSINDIFEYHIRNGLRETHEKQDTDILTYERAYEGVKCLAAAVLLTKTQNFYPVESEKQINDSKTLLPKSCLPDDWTDKEVKFLLQRRLFDRATYNTIKFYLKSVTEYLAAMWLKDRLDSSGDYLTIKSILFRKDAKTLIIKESFKPIAAWLAIGDRPWNNRIRQDILDSYPELFLKYGDTSKLPSEYVLSILKTLKVKYCKTKRIFPDDSLLSISYLGRYEFTPDFEEWLKDESVGETFKHFLMRIAFYSKMQGLSQISKQIVTNENIKSEIRNLAIHYLGVTDSLEEIDEIKKYLFSSTSLSNSFIAASFESLFPRFLNIEELFQLLKKTKEVEQYSFGIEYQLKTHLRNVLDSLNNLELIELIKIFNSLITTPPLHSYKQVSKKYYWIGDSLCIAVKELIKRNTELCLISESLYNLNSLKILGFLHGKFDEIIKCLEMNPVLRREYFWVSLSRIIQDKNTVTPKIRNIFGGYSSLSILKIEDIDWLIKDTKIPERREVALKYIGDYWDLFNRPLTKLYYYKKLCKDDLEVKKIFNFPFTFYFKSLLRKLNFKFNFSDSIFEIKIKIQRWRKNLVEQIFVYKNILEIQNGENDRLLSYLSFECMIDNGKYSIIDINKLKKKFSSVVSWAFSKGVKKYWHTFTPTIPHLKPNSIDGRTIIGFAGICLSLKDKELDFKRLNDTQAQQLAYYSLHELNGFPFWLNNLATDNSKNVAKVFKECIDADWNIKEGGELTIPFINKISSYSNFIIPLIKDYLVEKILGSSPSNISVLKSALRILIDTEKKKITVLSTNSLKNEVNSYKRAQTYILKKLDLKNSLSTLIDTEVEKIAILSTNSIKNEIISYKKIKTNILKKIELWFGVLIQLDTKCALKELESLFDCLSNDDKKSFMVIVCANLETRSDYNFPNVENPNYLNARTFKVWFKLVNAWVDKKEDIVRDGGYTPVSRDYAQDFRNSLLDRFIDLNGENSIPIFDEIMNDPSFLDNSERLLYYKTRITQSFSDQEKWKESDIPDFMLKHEVDPKSTYDLFQIVLKRLNNIKDKIERDEHGLNINNLKKELSKGDDEAELRKFITRELKENANGRYSVSAEEEMNPKVNPDIRIHSNSLQPVAIEIKWAQRWSGSDLFNKLEMQLVNQYLRPSNCNYGIYLIGFIKETGRNSNWKEPVTGGMLSFDELIFGLKENAIKLGTNDLRIEGLEIVDINFEN